MPGSSCQSGNESAVMQRNSDSLRQHWWHHYVCIYTKTRLMAKCVSRTQHCRWESRCCAPHMKPQLLLATAANTAGFQRWCQVETKHIHYKLRWRLNEWLHPKFWLIRSLPLRAYLSPSSHPDGTPQPNPNRKYVCPISLHFSSFINEDMGAGPSRFNHHPKDSEN